MTTANGGRGDKYPSGLIGPKSGTIVFCVDVKPMVEMAIMENNVILDSNFHIFSSNGTTTANTGGIEYVASQFKIYGGYVSHNAALRTLYRCLYETPIMGGPIADALALACDTTLYTEDIREYPSRMGSAIEIVLTAADQAGEILTPFDIQERATVLWHETYDRYIVEMEPFKEKYEVSRKKRNESRKRRNLQHLAT